MINKTEEFYINFEQELNKTIKKWPSLYMYKFILKTIKKEEINELISRFSTLNPEIIEKQSNKGTFVSITIKAKMKSSKEIIKYYKSLQDLKGIISL